MMRRAPLAIAALVALTFATPYAAAPRLITEKDLFKFTWIADPQISPDGTTVAFVRVTVNDKDNRYETALFVVPANGGEAPRRLTAGVRDTSPRWAPDSKRIAFVRAAEKDGKPLPPQVYLLQMDGGEARPITDIASGASSPAWSPDGKTIAFNSSTTNADMKKDEKKADDPTPAAEHVSDVEVVTRAVYRENGTPGYVDHNHHAHIFAVAVAEAAGVADRRPQPKQLTDGEFDERGIQWSPDAATIYFLSTRVAEPYYDESGDELYAVPAAGGPITKIAAIEGGISNVSVSPDGKRLAFIGELRGKPIRSY